MATKILSCESQMFVNYNLDRKKNFNSVSLHAGRKAAGDCFSKLEYQARQT